MKFQIALCQMGEETEKEKANQKMQAMVGEAVGKGADMVALPEMWNCPYSVDCFRKYGEEEKGRTVSLLLETAKKHKVYLIGGTIPELDQGRVYNTCYVFDPAGKIIGKHQKVHLFDVDVEGGVRFRESETLTPGNRITVVDTEFCKVGIAICYDIRFPEMMIKMALAGVKLMVIPAAFSLPTGAAHWELLMRTRAIDNQVYLAAAAPARKKGSIYTPYGHSLVVDPWGEVVASVDEKERVLHCQVDTDFVDKIRGELPLLKHRREEIYQKKGGEEA